MKLPFFILSRLYGDDCRCRSACLEYGTFMAFAISVQSQRMGGAILKNLTFLTIPVI